MVQARIGAPVETRNFRAGGTLTAQSVPSGLTIACEGSRLLQGQLRGGVSEPAGAALGAGSPPRPARQPPEVPGRAGPRLLLDRLGTSDPGRKAGLLAGPAVLSPGAELP